MTPQEIAERRMVLNALQDGLIEEEQANANAAQQAQIDQQTRMAEKRARLEAEKAEQEAILQAEEEAMLQARADQKVDRLLAEQALAALADTAKTTLQNTMGDLIRSITFANPKQATILWHREPTAGQRAFAESILRASTAHGV